MRGLSWFAAWSYSRWVGGRLPTEEEWERAADLLHRAAVENRGPATPKLAAFLGEAHGQLAAKAGPGTPEFVRRNREALAAYRKAVELSKWNEAYLNNLAAALSATGDYAGAIERYVGLIQRVAGVRIAQ